MLKEESKIIKLIKNGNQIKIKVTRKGLGFIKTKFGNFHVYNFEVGDKWKDYTVIVKSRINESNKPVFENLRFLLRIDSACTTGQIFGDLTCDCDNQLKYAMAELEKNGNGAIIRINTQDGRGMGTGFKLVTLLMQKEQKCSTVNAFYSLSGKLDDRDYYGAVALLIYLNVPKTISLITNSPSKLKELEENGYSVTIAKTPIKITKENKIHLSAKKKYLGHLIEV